ncbi:MAG: LysM peptidoglycan-binding domain-containing protein [Catalinimonas sp.]
MPKTRARPRSAPRTRRPARKRLPKQPAYNPLLLKLLVGVWLVAAAGAAYLFVVPRLGEWRTQAEEMVRPLDPPGLTAGGIWHTYRLRADESYYVVAGRLNLPADTLRSWNPAVDTPRAGTPLRVRVLAVHEVAPGEGLKAVALRYATTQEDLIRANALPNDDLRVGQQLVVPLPYP